MRINKYVAQATGLSRRRVDELIKAGAVLINGQRATLGSEVTSDDKLSLNGREISLASIQTIIFNKPTGYVVSRQGQGNPTVYDILPIEFESLKPVGRLDKDSSGLLVFTNDGELANRLSHPSFEKDKIYKVQLDRQLTSSDLRKLRHGVMLEDGISNVELEGQGSSWTVILKEGRNRQIRRTFIALGYQVRELHRIQFGPYKLGHLKAGGYLKVK